MEASKNLYLSLLPVEVITTHLVRYLSYQKIKELSCFVPACRGEEFWRSLITTRYHHRMMTHLNYDQETIFQNLETKYQVVIINSKQQNQQTIRLNSFIRCEDTLAGLIICFDIIKERDDCLLIFPPKENHPVQRNFIEAITSPFKANPRSRIDKVSPKRYIFAPSFPTRRDKQLVYLKKSNSNFSWGVKQVSKVYTKEVIIGT